MRILIVEDDDETNRFVARGLAELGHHVVTSTDGRDGLFQATGDQFDALIVDRMLPGLDGLSLIKALRAAGNMTPALMLTAVGGIADRVEGLEGGADDYLVKPFALQEVEARLQVLARRTKANVSRVLNIADLEYNLDTLEVHRGGGSIQLNPTALKILQALMESSPSVVTRTELETKVWGEELPDSDSLRVHIHGLRAAIDKPFPTHLIQTRHGIGYRIVDPDAVQA